MRSCFVVFLSLILMVACKENLVKSEFRATDNGSWYKDSIVEFSFSDLDTMQGHDIFINLRNDENFPYNNIFLIAELDFPNGETLTDTLEYEMAMPDGQWLGHGYGSIKENKLWYKQNIVFSSSGVYTLRLAHAMRKNGTIEGVENLEGVTDVGFEIFKK